ncbi:four helix bundle protein [Cyclobacterium xiamenense]|uniref:four helix bundle protein n=1 Tax=Cyclobacterium xiamenense TaxID=1297121 RepID=UPI0035CFE36E
MDSIKSITNLPNNRIGWTITDQIIRSSISVAANYRAVCRSKSNRDFISKMGTEIEAANETLFWLEMIKEAKLMAGD